MSISVDALVLYGWRSNHHSGPSSLNRAGLRVGSNLGGTYPHHNARDKLRGALAYPPVNDTLISLAHNTQGHICKCAMSASSTWCDPFVRNRPYEAGGWTVKGN